MGGLIRLIMRILLAFGGVSLFSFFPALQKFHFVLRISQHDGGNFALHFRGTVRQIRQVVVSCAF